jgi:GLPGLI family protein
MTSKRFNISMVATLMVVALVLVHAFTIGYGSGFSSRGRAMMAVQQAKRYTPSLLTVKYERHNDNIKDMLHLEIDTTYRTIGRGSFCYKTICDRKISLRTSSGEYFTAEQARNCFIEGGSRQWITQHDAKRIEGYDCGASLAVEGGLLWQAWYTEQLPHCCANTTIDDGLKGLILAAQSGDGRWSIKATKIDLTIG